MKNPNEKGGIENLKGNIYGNFREICEKRFKDHYPLILGPPEYRRNKKQGGD